MWTRRALAAAGAVIAVCLTAAIPARAQDELPEPDGRVLLTISGEIAVTNRGGEAAFDRAMLQNLGMRELRTRTDWTEGEQVFKGPLLRTVLDRVGADGTTLEAIALNDYSVEIPAADADDHEVIIAMRRNGERMTVRNKGPLWVVYPHPHPGSDKPNPHAPKMIWQLAKIDVR